jgi:hypothetical protein
MSRKRQVVETIEFESRFLPRSSLLALVAVLTILATLAAGCTRSSQREDEIAAQSKAAKAYAETVDLYVRVSELRSNLIDETNKQKHLPRSSLTVIKHDVEILDKRIAACDNLSQEFKRLSIRSHDLLWDTDFNRLIVQLPEYHDLVQKDERFVQAIINDIRSGTF